jgi:glycosyltransferase involved in cell wall biosynthesis
MRILHILNDVQKFGNGIVNVAVDLACLQASSGNVVGVASSGGEYQQLLADYGVRHFQLDQTRQPINLLKAAWRYRKIIQELQPHIVHAHMMTGVTLAWALRGRTKYHLVSTVHNEYQRSAMVMGLAERVIGVSKAVAQSMARRGISEHKLRVVCNGTLGSPRTRPLTDYQPILLERPAITTVAGMWRRKGISELIAAFGEIAEDFPEAHLYLVGKGLENEVFKAQAQKTSVDSRIHFEGFQSEPQRYLLSTDIFVLASHRDPSPLVIPEAREAGCAIIASNVDGIPEALDGGKAGILVPPFDSHTLAETLGQLLSHPYELESWKNKAKQNLGWLSALRVNQETMTLYQELISNNY